MRKLLGTTLMLMGSALFMLPAISVHAAGDAVDETKSVEPQGYVSVDVVRGRVEIIGWDKSEVHVEGTLDEETRAFVFDVDGDETRIIVELEESRRGFFGGSDGADLEIYVPHASQTEFRGVSTDLDVEGLSGSVELGVVSGDISLNGGQGRIEVQSVSGDIDIRDVTGRIKVSSVSGDIDVNEGSGEARYTSVSGDIQIFNGAELMELESVSGDIEVTSKLIRSATGHSVSGDIELVADVDADSLIEFNSASGSIMLALGGTVDARIRLDTASGSIENRLTDDQPDKPRYGNGEELRFSVGEGRGQIRLSSGSGDLELDSK